MFGLDVWVEFGMLLGGRGVGVGEIVIFWFYNKLILVNNVWIYVDFCFGLF